jgi:hypothetical protein
MSWRRKSEYGWNTTLFRLATGESPVRKVSQWQWLQPRAVKTRLPAHACAVIAFRGGGASRVMKSVKATMPEPSSLSSGKGLQERRLQSPPGQFSSGNSGLVMPISFRYASPENW